MSTQTKSKAAPKKPPAPYRAVRMVPLAYNQETELELEGCVKILGIHAQPEGGVDEEGKARQKYVRTVEPQLVYLYEAGAPGGTVTVLLLRGQADLPLDPEKQYEYLAATIDKHPKRSGLATAWLVTPA